MLQGEFGLVGPLLHRGNHKDYGKNGQNSRGNYGTGQAPSYIPQRIFPQIRVGNPAIPDVEPLQDLQNADAAEGGISITMAMTAPRLKSGIPPSIWL